VTAGGCGHRLVDLRLGGSRFHLLQVDYTKSGDLLALATIEDLEVLDRQSPNRLASLSHHIDRHLDLDDVGGVLKNLVDGLGRCVNGQSENENNRDGGFCRHLNLRSPGLKWIPLDTPPLPP
jgi:hypothetical protein